MKIKWPGFDAETVAAIEEYLDLDGETEIVWRSNSGPSGMENDAVRGYSRYRAAGASGKSYNRPMFEPIDNDRSSAGGRVMTYATACSGCDDWSRTARCEFHPELPLDEQVRRCEMVHDSPWVDDRPGPRVGGFTRVPGLPLPNSWTLDSYRAALSNTSRYYGFEVRHAVARHVEEPSWSIDVSGT